MLGQKLDAEKSKLLSLFQFLNGSAECENNIMKRVMSCLRHRKQL